MHLFNTLENPNCLAALGLISRLLPCLNSSAEGKSKSFGVFRTFPERFYAAGSKKRGAEAPLYSYFLPSSILRS